MEWALGAAAAFVLYLYGRSHQWWGGAASTASAPIVCDIEADMPDALKQSVLAQVASQTNPLTLQEFASGLAQANYIQSAYCLNQRAWVLSGSVPPAPVAPTAAQIATAQAARAAAAANLGQTSLGQIQVAPGTPSMNAPIGTLIAVTGATPYDPTSNPTGFAVSAAPTTATALSDTVWALVGSGSMTINWGTSGQTVITAMAPAAAAAVAAATPAPAAAGSAAASASVPGLDPNSIQAAVDSLGNLTSTATNASATVPSQAQIPATTSSMPSQTSGFAHRNDQI